MYEGKSPQNILNEYYKSKGISLNDTEEKTKVLLEYFGHKDSERWTLSRLETEFVRKKCEEFQIR